MTLPEPLRIDIVSDIVCPWCAIGYNQLRVALEQLDCAYDIHWHPFQLNPQMPPEGQNLRDHLASKYGVSAEQSVGNRERITALGADVGFAFNFTDETRTYNTFDGHRLIHWAREQGKEHEMKLALLGAYFTDGKDVSDIDTLVEQAQNVGLDGAAAKVMLLSDDFKDQIREHLDFWTRQGITGVPAVVLNSKYLVSGAAGVEHFIRAIKAANAEATGK